MQTAPEQRQQLHVVDRQAVATGNVPPALPYGWLPSWGAVDLHVQHLTGHLQHMKAP
jgi:hypothetical protein